MATRNHKLFWGAISIFFRYFLILNNTFELENQQIFVLGVLFLFSLSKLCENKYFAHGTKMLVYDAAQKAPQNDPWLN